MYVYIYTQSYIDKMGFEQQTFGVLQQQKLIETDSNAEGCQAHKHPAMPADSTYMGCSLEAFQLIAFKGKHLFLLALHQQCTFFCELF